jgi:S1-C subfamily serine protease
MIKKILFLFIVFSLGTSFGWWSNYQESYVPDVYPFGMRNMSAAAKSSVIITALDELANPISSGSGNYFRHKGRLFIITAAHVVDEGKYIAIQERGPNIEFASVIYSDPSNDIAVLVTENQLKYTLPAYFKVDNHVQYAEPICYVGAPAGVAFYPAQGLVVEKRGEYILTNIFAWPGSSGSVVFSDDGIVGIVSSVMMKQDLFGADIISNIAMLSDINKLDMKVLEDLLKNERDRLERGDADK